MQFNSDKAYKQLLTGRVATMRSFLYRVGHNIRLYRHRKYIGLGRVCAVLTNKKSYREKLVKDSGFNTVEEWEKEAIRLHGKLPYYIICVKLMHLEK
jgi:hypothetical protein